MQDIYEFRVDRTKNAWLWPGQDILTDKNKEKDSMIFVAAFLTTATG